MIDLEQLEAEHREAETDRADLFDFYHKHWSVVISELLANRDRLKAIEAFHDLKRTK